MGDVGKFVKLFIMGSDPANVLLLKRICFKKVQVYILNPTFGGKKQHFKPQLKSFHLVSKHGPEPCGQGLRRGSGGGRLGLWVLLGKKLVTDRGKNILCNIVEFTGIRQGRFSVRQESQIPGIPCINVERIKIC